MHDIGLRSEALDEFTIPPVDFSAMAMHATSSDMAMKQAP
jgi:hypothetical protein